MTHRLSRPIVATLCLALSPALHTSAVRADAPGATATTRPHGYVHAGIGLLEIAHLQAGGFLTPRLTVDGMMASLGVFGAHFGGGLTYAIGPTSPGRPPRHALLLGARVMLNADASFDSHGDDLTSYIVAPIGYGFLANNGFSFRVAVGPVIDRERKADSHAWTIGGPFLTASAGYWF